MFIAPVGCVGKKTTTPATTDTQLRPDVTALQKAVGLLQGDVSNLQTPPNYEPDIKALKQQVADLETANSDFEDRIAELEAGSPGTNGDGDIEYTTTRWSPTISLGKETPGALYVNQASVSWYPTRIKEEDTYRLTFDIVNTGVAQTKQTLYIIFSPSSRDTLIDVSNTGMYSTSPVSIWWDVEYTPSDGVDCRRIEFISDQFDIPAGPDPMEVKVDFDLYYER